MATWNISFTIPNDKVTDVRDSVSAYLGYAENIPNPENPEETIPNPETKPQFIYRNLKDYLKNCYIAQKAKDADSHRVTAVQDADSVNIEVA